MNENGNWEFHRDTAFSYNSGGDRVEGRVKIYRYVGPKPKSGKAPAFGAVYTKTHHPSAYVCTGDLGKAFLNAAGMRKSLRLGSAKMIFTDWGGPVGKPSNGGSLVWSDPSRK